MDLSQFGVVDPQILKMLQDAYAANPTLRTSIGESDAGALYGIDPRARQGDYYLNLDEQGKPLIYKDLERNTWGQDSAIAYDMNGNPVGMSSGDSTALGLAKFIAASAAAYGGVNAADGLVNGAAAGAGSGAGAVAPEMTNGAWLGEGVASGVPAWDAAAFNSALGSGQLGTAVDYFAQNPTSSLGIGGSTPSAPGTGSGASGSGVASSLVNGAKDVMGTNTGQLIGAGLGAVAGAIDSQDKEQSVSKEPWSKAQPFLEQLLGQGQQLATRYQQQPFSPAQQQAYANMGGLLGGINQSMPGLLSQMSSQQQFVRGGQPTRTQGVNLQWQPGLLGNYGT